MSVYRARKGGAESRRAQLIARAVATSALTVFAGLATTAQAQIVPTGAVPVSGGVSVGTPAANAGGGLDLTVTQTGARGVVEWSSFSVGALDRVTFAQPDATSATLNRVTGGTASTIAGQIGANGSVYLVNPNGIAITASGTVQTGGAFVASTLDITNDNFTNSVNSFGGTGASARVSNAGSIAASGFVALLGGTVSHSGTITVPVGKVALGAGEAATIDVNGGNFLQVTTPTNAVAANGAALIEVGGSITVRQNADTGTAIQISAATAANAVRNAINLTGTLSATSATGGGGRILLQGGAGGAVNVAGSLASRGTTIGGAVTVTGDQISLNNATLNVAATNNGATGGLVDVTGSAVAANGSLSTALDTANSVYLYSTATGSGDGAVRIAAPLISSGAGELVLIARTDIALAGVTARNLRLSMNAGNNVAYAGTVGTSGAIDVGLFNLTNGNWSQTGTLPAFAARDFRFNVSGANFLRTTGGDGSAATPYRIADVYGLQGMASGGLLASRFALAGNVDAAGTAQWNGGAGFVPIGTDGAGNIWNGTAFAARDAASIGMTGGLDGGGFAVVGLTVNRPTVSFQGLIGWMSAAGVANLTVGGRVTGYEDVGGVIGHVGAQAGASVNAVVSNVAVTGSGNLFTLVSTGGLIGYMDAGAVTASRATGTVSGTRYVGGLVGGMGGGTQVASITGSSATGAVTGYAYVGGLVGYQLATGAAASITGSFATGAVRATIGSGTAGAGGLVGFVASNGAAGTTAFATIDQSYATGAVAISGAGVAGGLAGQINTGSGLQAAVVRDSYATGSVLANTNTGGLVGIANGVNFYNSYATGPVRGENINVGGLVGNTSRSAYFNVYATGSVMGTGSVGGLIGTASLNSTVLGGYATGRVSATSSSAIGGLVGNASATTLSGVYATGAVSLINVGSSNSNVGGLVGLAFNTAIRGAWASGGAVSTGGTVGGLVGALTGSSRVSDAYATGTVNGTTLVGGLVGSVAFQATVTSVYATGRVTGTSGPVGGLIGNTANGSTVTNAYWDTYSTGSGLGIGSGPGSVTAVTSDPAQAAAANYAFKASAYAALAGATNIGTANVTASGSVAGFMFAAGNQTRPFLAFEAPVVGNPLVTADANGRAVLTGAHQLQLVNGYATTYNGAASRDRLQGNYALGRDLDLSETGRVADGVAAINSTTAGTLLAAAVAPGSANSYAGMWGAAGWNPVGDDSIRFTGGFDGGGRNVTGLYVNRPGQDNVGLFGETRGTLNNGTPANGTLGNVALTGVRVTGRDNVGGLVGQAATVNNASSTGSVVATGIYAGGLVGLANGAVTGSTSAGTVSGVGTAGGLIGFAFAVDRSSSSAAVTTTGTAFNAGAGGLVGYAAGDVSDSFATGSVTGATASGGLIGTYRPDFGGTIARVWASGSVTGTTNEAPAGGLIGNFFFFGGNQTFESSGALRQAYATGAVANTGTSGVAGGLVGVSAGSIDQTYATGAVSAATAGGLIGVVAEQGIRTGPSAGRSWASGRVSGATTGGIAGRNDAGISFGTIYWDSYSTGQLAAVSGGSTIPSGVAVTSDPARAGAMNYAYRAGAYAVLPGAAGLGTATPTGFAFVAGNSTRPFLAFEVPVVGSGSVRTNAGGQVVLANAHQLQLVGYNAATNAGNYALAANIDLAETGRVVVGTPGSYSGMWAGTGFVSLGSDGAGNLWNGASFVAVGYADVGKAGIATGFSGSLNGGGFTLSNLSINRAGVQNVGLFGGSSGAISNLTVSGNVTGYISVGGLVGLQQGGSITGVTSAVNVTGSTGSAYVGGLVGFASGTTIGSSSASGTVSGTGATGGLVGLLYNSVLTNSSASAVVNGRAGRTGGLVGIVERSTVTGGSSTGTVNGVANGPSYGSLRDGGTYNGVGEVSPN